MFDILPTCAMDEAEETRRSNYQTQAAIPTPIRGPSVHML